MTLENHTGTLCPALGGWGAGRQLPVCWASLRHLPPSLQIRPKVPPPGGGGGGGQGGSVSADFSTSKQAVPGNRSKQDSGAGWGWVEVGPPYPVGAKAPPSWQPTQGLRAGRRRTGRGPWATPRFQGQRSGSVLAHGHGHLPSPSCSAVSSALLSPNTPQPREGPRFPRQPRTRREEGGEGGTSASHQRQGKDSVAADTRCARTLPRPPGVQSQCCGLGHLGRLLTGTLSWAL